jgi:predicted dehydrogenase
VSQLFGYEFERRARVGLVGCGEHSFRNILPALQYAPVDLVATCDLDIDRARVVGRLFGAERAYSDYLEMIEKERLDIVYMAIWPAGAPAKGAVPTPYPPMVVAAMEAGASVWIEKPPANSLVDAERMRDASFRTGKFLGVGYKRMYFPTTVKAREIMGSPSFGTPTMLQFTYRDKLGGLADPVHTDLSHPLGLVYGLMGPADEIHVERHDETAGALITFRFRSGALGSLFLMGAPSPTGPGEHAVVVGEGEHIVIDNVIRLAYYRRPLVDRRYGRDATFMHEADDAPILWEPEFSLGQLYNKNIFLLGYVGLVGDFAAAVLDGRPPDRAGADDMVEILRWTEAIYTPSGTTVSLGSSGSGEPA